MSRVIDESQVLDRSPFRGPVKNEIHRPHLVRHQWTFEWMAICGGDLLSLASFYLQAGFGIQPIDALVIDDLTGLPEF